MPLEHFTALCEDLGEKEHCNYRPNVARYNQINYAIRAVLIHGDIWESWSIKSSLFFI